MFSPLLLNYVRHFFLFVILFLLWSVFAHLNTFTIAAVSFDQPAPIYRTLGSETTRVSEATDGTQANGASSNASISGNGQYVAFVSVANNLVGGDLNNTRDIFLRDRQTGITSRESVATNGTQANDDSLYVALNENGRYIAFASEASNLVLNDTNNHADIFVRDRVAGITERVSLTNDEDEANNFSGTDVDISADGSLVVFTSLANNLVSSDTNSYIDIFMRNRIVGTTVQISGAHDGSSPNEDSFDPRVSLEGRYITFVSEASNLIAEDTNNYTDIFVYDRNTTTTSRVSVDSSNVQANGHSTLPIISGDGRYVAFESNANNLVDNDTNGKSDIFVHDRLTGNTERVSIGSSGVQGNGDSQNADISIDGRYVIFRSLATNLIVGDTNNFCDLDNDGTYTENCEDIFVHDRLTHETVLVSASSAGIQGNSYSGVFSSISDNGEAIAFDAFASNLVAGDSNGYTDVFVRDWVEPPVSPTPTSDGNTYLVLVQRGALPTPTSTPVPCLTAEIEPNDSFSATIQQPRLCQAQSIMGTFAETAPPPSPNDFYRLQINTASTIRVRLDGIAIGCDFDLELYDVNQNLVGSSYSSTNLSEQIPFTAQPGTYYVRVYRRAGFSPQPYTVGWTID